MTDKNKSQRKEIEDKAWDQIDVIKDTNKEELVNIIAQGMDSKTRLTTIQGEFKKQKSEKERLSTDIKDRQTKLNELVSTYNELKA
jgi:chromosome segregation ATPase